jgi:hypothetical protein
MRAVGLLHIIAGKREKVYPNTLADKPCERLLKGKKIDSGSAR